MLLVVYVVFVVGVGFDGDVHHNALMQFVQKVVHIHVGQNSLQGHHLLVGQLHPVTPAVYRSEGFLKGTGLC